MIIYHQSNVGGFAGGQVSYWPLNPITYRVSKTSAAAGVDLIILARSVARFTFGRVYGRVN